MSIILKYNNSEYKTETIFWDRDSFFIDFNNYWSRLVATIAQKVAENTTDNWNRFNQIRTQTIQLLGVNPETSSADPSAPVNILPVNSFHSLIASSLQNFLKEKTLSQLNESFKSLIEKALYESSNHLINSIILKNLDLPKVLKGKVNQVLITNDNEKNNLCFIEKTNTSNIFNKCITQAKKDNLEALFTNNVLFISSNLYLRDLYLKSNPDNFILINDLSEISYTEDNTQEVITINIDGASRGNPGPASIGIVFFSNNEVIHEMSEFLGVQTNNFAEYTALIRALETSLEKNYKSIEIKSDSELVVKQINKTYKVKDAYIKDLYDKATALINKLHSFKIIHIPREENLKADKLANNALNIKQSS